MTTLGILTLIACAIWLAWLIGTHHGYRMAQRRARKAARHPSVHYIKRELP